MKDYQRLNRFCRSKQQGQLRRKKWLVRDRIRQAAKSDSQFKKRCFSSVVRPIKICCSEFLLPSGIRFSSTVSSA